MARVSGTMTYAADALQTRAQPELYPGCQSATHKLKAKGEVVWLDRTARAWIWVMRPAVSPYSLGQARFCANEWKLRATTDPAKMAMIPEGRTFLLKEGILDIAVGSMKSDPYRPDSEKPWLDRIQNSVVHLGSQRKSSIQRIGASIRSFQSIWMKI